MRSLWISPALFVCVACRPAPEPTPQPIQSAQAPATASPTVIPTSVPPPIAPLSAGVRIEDERNTIAVFRQASASTVFVTQTRRVYDWTGEMEDVPAGSGSGFVWDTDGHIVTNYHVVKDAQSLTVKFDNQQTFDATVVGVEPRKDIAVIKVLAPKELLKPVLVAKGTNLEVGQKTVAIGNPFGLDHTLTTGIVSALGRQVPGAGGVTIRDMIQTDAAINPGNSGGPLLDSSGQLIGMNTMIYSKSGTSAGVGFAVPANTIARVVPQIIRSGHAEQVGFGIRLDPSQQLERRFGIKGVIVRGIVPNSSAQKAGLHAPAQSRDGVEVDVIVGVGNVAVENYDDLYNAIDAHRAGEKVELKVKRRDQVLTLPVELVSLP